MRRIVMFLVIPAVAGLALLLWRYGRDRGDTSSHPVTSTLSPHAASDSLVTVQGNAAPRAERTATLAPAPTAGTGMSSSADADLEAGQFPGSVLPLADGSAPDPVFAVKGNTKSMIYHTERSPNFTRTRASVWFRTEEDAQWAGFQPWSRKRRTVQ